MKPEQLLEMAKKNEEMGLEHLTLTMPSPNFGRRQYPLRVRTPFGLCRWYPCNDPTKIMIFVKVEQVKKWFQKILGPI